ncbi:MAG: hypothetical protein LBR81_10225 [Prevotellaceae bacterium]|jgi:hypothetical protein|nr:hypothetical protein [Prevotellaceae bacterium]
MMNRWLKILLLFISFAGITSNVSAGEWSVPENNNHAYEIVTQTTHDISDSDSTLPHAFAAVELSQREVSFSCSKKRENSSIYFSFYEKKYSSAFTYTECSSQSANSNFPVKTVAYYIFELRKITI